MWPNYFKWAETAGNIYIPISKRGLRHITSDSQYHIHPFSLKKELHSATSFRKPLLNHFQRHLLFRFPARWWGKVEAPAVRLAWAAAPVPGFKKPLLQAGWVLRVAVSSMGRNARKGERAQGQSSPFWNFCNDLLGFVLIFQAGHDAIVDARRKSPRISDKEI